MENDQINQLNMKIYPCKCYSCKEYFTERCKLQQGIMSTMRIISGDIFVVTDKIFNSNLECRQIVALKKFNIIFSLV